MDVYGMVTHVVNGEDTITYVPSLPEDCRSNCLHAYYDTHPKADLIMSIIECRSDVSLRLLDYFVWNYAKKHSISYSLNGSPLLVHARFILLRRTYTDLYFDAFNRWVGDGESGNFQFITSSTPNKCVRTSPGQLNFFRWAYEYGVLDYVFTHRIEISKHYAKDMRIAK